MHPDYAESLAEFGMPCFLAQSGGWILKRKIRDSRYYDAMGCYPIFACSNWRKLHLDLEKLDEVVCLSVVADPFGDYDQTYLKECFPDLVMPFKQHFVVDLSKSPATFVNSHHRRNARKALREIRLEKCDNPIDFLDEWTDLYSVLVQRHAIRGMTAFSRQCFSMQLRVPGIVMFRAIRDDAAVGMLLWYSQDNRAYYHLGAYNSTGYELGASFALFSYSLDYFAQHGFEWLNLGAGAGTRPAEESGLSRFKQGWSTGVRDAYFCGRIFDQQKYQEISEAQGKLNMNYFPAYRFGEFS